MKIYAAGDDIDEIQSVKDLFRLLPPPVTFFRNYIFRDQRDYSWDLTPSMFRLRPFESTGCDSWLAVEMQILHRFHTDAVPFLDKFIDSPVRRRMIAQHYGAPTRLLDWSGNPCAALFFATTKLTEHQTDGAFYVASPPYGGRAGSGIDWPTEAELETHEFFSLEPPGFDARIIAQQGMFTTHKLPSGKDPFAPLDKRESMPITTLFKLPVRHKFKAKIRLELEQIGVNVATLFPGLDGVGANVSWQFERANLWQAVNDQWPGR